MTEITIRCERCEAEAKAAREPWRIILWEADGGVRAGAEAYARQYACGECGGPLVVRETRHG